MEMSVTDVMTNHLIDGTKVHDDVEIRYVDVFGEHVLSKLFDQNTLE